MSQVYMPQSIPEEAVVAFRNSAFFIDPRGGSFGSDDRYLASPEAVVMTLAILRKMFSSGALPACVRTRRDKVPAFAIGTDLKCVLTLGSRPSPARVRMAFQNALVLCRCTPGLFFALFGRCICDWRACSAGEFEVNCSLPLKTFNLFA